MELLTKLTKLTKLTRAILCQFRNTRRKKYYIKNTRTLLIIFIYKYISSSCELLTLFRACQLCQLCQLCHFLSLLLPSVVIISAFGIAQARLALRLLIEKIHNSTPPSADTSPINRGGVIKCAVPQNSPPVYRGSTRSGRGFTSHSSLHKKLSP